MKIVRKIESGFDVQSIAGIGPSAWNRDSGSIGLPSRSHRGNNRQHIVKIDHEARKKAVAKDPDVHKLLDEEQFRSSEPLFWRILESSVGFAIIGSSLLSGL